jgi:hypothetical protein
VREVVGAEVPPEEPLTGAGITVGRAAVLLAALGAAVGAELLLECPSSAALAEYLLALAARLPGDALARGAPAPRDAAARIGADCWGSATRSRRAPPRRRSSPAPADPSAQKPRTFSVCHCPETRPFHC